MSNFWRVTAEDDGIDCLVREHWLYTAFHNILWDTPCALYSVLRSSLNIQTALQNGVHFA